MRIITASKDKDKDKKKKVDEESEEYWSLVEPKWYAKIRTASFDGPMKKIAYKSRKKEVSLKGTLEKTEDGFVYLDLSNDVIHGLFTLIDEDGIEKPPYFKGDRSAGAHISVMSGEEITDKEIKEVGDKFNFKLGDFYSVAPEGWENMERVWFVEVESPELEELRKKYNLPKSYKGKGHNFHVTVAVKRKAS